MCTLENPRRRNRCGACDSRRPLEDSSNLVPVQSTVGAWLQRRNRTRANASTETARQNGEQQCNIFSSNVMFLKVIIRVNGTVKEDTLVAMKMGQPEKDELDPKPKPFSRNDDRASGVQGLALEITSSGERSPNSLCLPDQLLETQPILDPKTKRDARSLTPCPALVTSSKLDFDQGMDPPLNIHNDIARATENVVTSDVLNESNSSLSQVQRAATKLEVESTNKANNNERVSHHPETDKFDNTKRSNKDATQLLGNLSEKEEVEHQTQHDAVEMGGYDVARYPSNPPKQEHSPKLAGDRSDAELGPSIDSVLRCGRDESKVLIKSDQSMAGTIINCSVNLSEADEESRQSQSESQRNQRVVMFLEVVSSENKRITSESELSCTQGSTFSQLMTQQQGGFVYTHTQLNQSQELSDICAQLTLTGGRGGTIEVPKYDPPQSPVTNDQKQDGEWMDDGDDVFVSTNMVRPSSYTSGHDSRKKVNGSVCFANPGAGVKVLVSDKRMARQGKPRIINEGKGTIAATVMEHALLAPTVKGSKINLCEQALIEASALWTRDTKGGSTSPFTPVSADLSVPTYPSILSGKPLTMQPIEDTTSVSWPQVVGDKGEEWQVRELQNESFTPVKNFSAAGTGSTIHVSNDSLAKANAFWQIGNRVYNSNNSIEPEANLPIMRQVQVPVASFSTAGMGSAIHVSNDSLAKANAFWHTGSHTNSSNNSSDPEAKLPSVGRAHVPVASFSTAKGSTIHISNDSLSKANAFWQTDNRINNSIEQEAKLPGAGETHVPVTSFSTAGKGSAMRVSNDSVAKANALWQTDTCTTRSINSSQQEVMLPIVDQAHVPVASFFTAGKGSTVHISNDALAKAKAFWQTDDRLSHPNNSTKQEATLPSVGQAHVPVPFFSGAGMGSTIQVSKDSRAKANAFWQFDDGTNSSINALKQKVKMPVVGQAHVQVASFSTAGKGSTIHIRNDSLAKANAFWQTDSHTNSTNNSFEQDEQLPVATGSLAHLPVASFSTAGMGSAIHVSSDSLAKANAFWHTDSHTNSSNNSSEPEAKLPSDGRAVPVASFSTAKGSTIHISNDSLSKANALWQTDIRTNYSHNALEQVGQAHVPVASFSTAGMGSAIHVSNDSLAKANAFWHTDCHTNSSNNSSDPEAKLPSVGRAVPVASFSTAKGSTIHISNDSLSKANALWQTDIRTNNSHNSLEQVGQAHVPVASFSTAGKGSAIRISNDSLAKANAFWHIDTNGTSNSFEQQTKLHDVGQAHVPVASFFTSGNSCTIHTSNDSLAKVNAFQQADNRTNTSNYSSAQEVKLLNVAQVRVPVASFSTAGEGSTSLISNNTLAKSGAFSSESSQPRITSPHCGVLSPPFASSATVDNGSNLPSDSSTKAVSLFHFVADSNCSDQALEQGRNLSLICEASPTLLVTSEQGVETQETDTPELGVLKSGFEFDSTQHGAPYMTIDSGDKVSTKITGPGDDHGVDDRKCDDDSSRTFGDRGRKPIAVQSTPQSQIAYGDSFTQGTLRSSSSQQSLVRFEVHQDSIDKRECSVSCSERKFRQISFGLNDSWPGEIIPEPAETPKGAGFKASAVVTRSTNMKNPYQRKRMCNQQDQSSVDLGSPVAIHFNEYCGDESNNIKEIDVNSKDEGTNLSGCKEKMPCNWTINVADCVADGVDPVIVEVDAMNAVKLRFDRDSGLPCTFFGNPNPSTRRPIGGSKYLREALVKMGCDDKSFTDKWIANHCRWIVWKLASIERRFSACLAGKYCTMNRLLSQLQARYVKEIECAQRSSLRKVLNRDVASSRMMILCVSYVLPPLKPKKQIFDNNNDNSNPSTDSGVVYECRIELTDGWYGVQAVLDSKLRDLVMSGRIAVGTKLLVSNAVLKGAEDGVDPLDEAYTSTKSNAVTGLCLFVNSTRLAKWDAKLGFVPRSKRQEENRGNLLVTSLSDVVLGGGSIPLMDLIVCRVYPRLYLEKTAKSAGGNGHPPIISVAEEHSRRLEFEKMRQKAMETMSDSIQRECARDVDEMAPDLWKGLIKSASPECYYEHLSKSDKDTIDQWKEKRTSILIDRVRKEVDAQLEVDESMFRESTPFIKVFVKSHTPCRNYCEGAFLTLWNHTEEQLSLLREGSVVRFYNLSVGESKYEGMLRLTAGAKTLMEPSPCADNFATLYGYKSRSYTKLVVVQALSKRLEHGSLPASPSPEVDVAGVVLKVVEEQYQHSIYLTDECGLILRVDRDGAIKETDPLKDLSPHAEQNMECPIVMAFRDLRVLPYDSVNLCAVAIYTSFSSTCTKQNSQVSRLQTWASYSTLPLRAASYLDVGLPIIPRKEKNVTFALGYIMGFQPNKDSEAIKIQVDCAGSSELQLWDLPLFLFHETIALLKISSDALSLNPDEETRYANLRVLSKLLGGRGMLLRFGIQRAGTVYEIRQITAVSAHSLAKVYLSVNEAKV